MSWYKPIIQASYCYIGVWKAAPTIRAVGVFLEALQGQRALWSIKHEPCRHPSSECLVVHLHHDMQRS